MTTLYLVPGDDFLYSATVTDEDGDAYSLAGATVRFTVKRRISDDDDDALAALYWVSGGDSEGITVATPATGVVSIHIDDAATAAFTQAAHHWSLEVTDTATNDRTVDSGWLVVLSRATAAIVAP